MASAEQAPAADPAAPDFDPRVYLKERYVGAERSSALLKGYYVAKPLLPRRVQIALRRAYAPRQAGRRFPAWPIEPILVHHRSAQLRRRLDAAGADRVPFVNYWPDGKRFAAVLTHDVEGPLGIDNIGRVLEVERKYRFVSSWNFVAEWYPIPPGTFETIREAGCEVGVHGVKHDGRLFENRRRFDQELPKIHHYLREWDAVGFRSPALHRNADWMPELGCLYDTSFPDTDPFEPQSGGCCSILPFFLGDLVELPVTLAQDHTLWEVLRDRSIDRWVEKSRWLIANHGLINVIVHPDYVAAQERLDLYERFLQYLASEADGWQALPREVAAWWNERTSLRCEGSGDGDPRIVGSNGHRGTVAWARRAGNGVAIEL